jgi:WhiB family transcriptional regulator, redox-sensing transcriptional regulator
VKALLERLQREEVNSQVMSWRAKGRCRGSDPAVFYPPPEDDSQAEEAKLICGICPVRQPCLEFALTTREKHGVWGGLTERERRRVLRQRRKTA